MCPNPTLFMPNKPRLSRAYSHPLSPALCGDLLLSKSIFQKLTKIYTLRSLETDVRIRQSHRAMLYVKYCDCLQEHSQRDKQHSLQNRVQKSNPDLQQDSTNHGD